MTVDETVRMLELKVTSYQLLAMRYLEAQGQRFCVEFGIENAIEKAREHWRARRRRK